MKLNIDLILRIIAWGLIVFGVLVILLKWVGIVKSPSPLSLETLIAAGILIELGRIETKLSLLWEDFKKRKKM